MVNKQRLLLVVSGPSGVGKDSVVSVMMAHHKQVQLSVSATTRRIRAGEEDGINYHYMTKEEFCAGVDADEFLEHACYAGEFYGTLKKEVDNRIDNGVTCVLVIEVCGAARIKKLYPECTTVFILPPTPQDLENRIRGRGRETEEEVCRRIAVANEQEIPLACTYDYRIVNHDLESCAEELYEILHKRQTEP